MTWDELVDRVVALEARVAMLELRNTVLERDSVARAAREKGLSGDPDASPSVEQKKKRKTMWD